MVLTKDFRETIQARAQSEPEFRKAMLTEAIDSFLAGDIEVGKAMLRDYINATIGFEELAKILNKSGKSIHRMLGPAGNPKASNFFQILKVLQQREAISLKVSADYQVA
jgi:hypothetical protein